MFLVFSIWNIFKKVCMSFANDIELCYKSGSGPFWLRRHNLEEKWLGVRRFAIMRTVKLFGQPKEE